MRSGYRLVFMPSLPNAALKKKLSERLGETNPFALPRIDRIVVNAGVGKRVVAEGKKSLEPIERDLARITGQRPAVRPARKSIASFKLREGVPAGIMVTLRGRRAEDFLTRLIRIALPRTRDFRGVSPATLDARGNLNIGIREQTVFPEAAMEPTGVLFGFEITIVTTAKNRKEGEALFRAIGFPLREE